MSDKEIIVRLEAELQKAMLNSDVKTLELLIDDSLTFIIPGGIVAGKTMDIQAYKSGSQCITALKPSEQVITMYENMATVTVKVELEGSFMGESISGLYRYLRVWHLDSDIYKIVAGSVTRIA